MAREPEAVAELRRALGERLSTFRQAAALTQAQLARATMCDRSTVAHAEKGRSRADDRFWIAADDACHAGGTLLAVFHEFHAAKSEHNHRIHTARLADARARVACLRVPGGSVLPPQVTVPDPDERARLADLCARPRLVDSGALRMLGNVLAEQRRLEDVIGALALIQSLRAQLAVVRDLVVEARGAVRPSVVALGSQYAQFTAWIHTSIGEATRRG
jgi:transcriptional regulator with XRE-family HTH domain